jgi:hypothetical protein
MDLNRTPTGPRVNRLLLIINIWILSVYMLLSLSVVFGNGAANLLTVIP